MQAAWKVVYYINFLTCWFVLPFAQEYEDSGEFTFAKKLKDSLVMNGLLFGAIGIGAIVFLIVILVMGEYSFSQLPALVATIANAFGLTLVSVLLGYGLISFPKECFLRKDYKKIVNHCHRQAEAIQAEQLVILEEVYCIRKVIERSDQRYGEPEGSQRREIRSLIEQTFKFQGCLEDEEAMAELGKKSNAELHKKVKKRIVEWSANNSQLDELVDDLKSTTESYLANNYSRKRVLFTVLFAVTSLLSVLIFFAEVATFARFLAPANLLALVGVSGVGGLVANALLTGYIAFVVTHTIFRIKVYRVFLLHRGHSSASSLLFTAINLARISYPLCYNYLQLTGLPPSAFLAFFGEVNLRDEVTVVFPILMLVFALFNLLDLYDKIMGYLGFGSYAFDAEEAAEKKEEGRNILIERFKERSIQNNHLEMIQLL